MKFYEYREEIPKNKTRIGKERLTLLWSFVNSGYKIAKVDFQPEYKSANSVHIGCLCGRDQTFILFFWSVFKGLERRLRQALVLLLCAQLTAALCAVFYRCAAMRADGARPVSFCAFQPPFIPRLRAPYHVQKPLLCRCVTQLLQHLRFQPLATPFRHAEGRFAFNPMPVPFRRLRRELTVHAMDQVDFWFRVQVKRFASHGLAHRPKLLYRRQCRAGFYLGICWLVQLYPALPDDLHKCLLRQPACCSCFFDFHAPFSLSKCVTTAGFQNFVRFPIVTGPR